MTVNKRVIAAVDASSESAWAAAVAWSIAERAHAEFDAIHVTSDVSAIPATLEPKVDLQGLMAHATEGARQAVHAKLLEHFAPEVADHIEVILGNAGWSLPREAKRREADLMALGGKRHSTLRRWFAGSVAHHLVRTNDIRLSWRGDM